MDVEHIAGAINYFAVAIYHDNPDITLTPLFKN